MKRGFPYLVLAASFTLAASAAYYSVFGLSKLFSSQSLAIIILAGSLESAKLITASYLHRYWTKISMFIKTYMMIAILVLMSITSLGIYGFLVSAYQNTAYKLENLDSVTNAMITKKSRFESQIVKLNHESESINKNIDNLTGALANNVIRYTDAKGNQVVRTSNENRKAYESQLKLAASRLDTLNAQESILNDSITAIDMRILNLKTNLKPYIKLIENIIKKNNKLSKYEITIKKSSFYIYNDFRLKKYIIKVIDNNTHKIYNIATFFNSTSYELIPIVYEYKNIKIPHQLVIIRFLLLNLISLQLFDKKYDSKIYQTFIYNIIRTKKINIQFKNIYYDGIFIDDKIDKFKLGSNIYRPWQYFVKFNKLLSIQ